MQCEYFIDFKKSPRAGHFAFCPLSQSQLTSEQITNHNKYHDLNILKAADRKMVHFLLLTACLLGKLLIL